MCEWLINVVNKESIDQICVVVMKKVMVMIMILTMMTVSCVFKAFVV